MNWSSSCASLNCSTSSYRSSHSASNSARAPSRPSGGQGCSASGRNVLEVMTGEQLVAVERREGKLRLEHYATSSDETDGRTRLRGDGNGAAQESRRHGRHGRRRTRSWRSFVRRGSWPSWERRLEAWKLGNSDDEFPLQNAMIGNGIALCPAATRAKATASLLRALSADPPVLNGHILTVHHVHDFGHIAGRGLA